MNVRKGKPNSILCVELEPKVGPALKKANVQ